MLLRQCSLTCRVTECPVTTWRSPSHWPGPERGPSPGSSPSNQAGRCLTLRSGSALRVNLSSSSDQKMNKYFPIKKCRVSNTDKPWITKQIKLLDKCKKIEYKKHGNIIKYHNLLKANNYKLKSAAQLNLRRNVTDLMEAAPGKAWATFKKMGAQPSDCGGEGLSLCSYHA